MNLWVLCYLMAAGLVSLWLFWVLVEDLEWRWKLWKQQRANAQRKSRCANTGLTK